MKYKTMELVPSKQAWEEAAFVKSRKLFYRIFSTIGIKTNITLSDVLEYIQDNKTDPDLQDIKLIFDDNSYVIIPSPTKSDISGFTKLFLRVNKGGVSESEYTIEAYLSTDLNKSSLKNDANYLKATCDLFKRFFKEEWPKVKNNSDSLFYLGGVSYETHTYDVDGGYGGTYSQREVKFKYDPEHLNDLIQAKVSANLGTLQDRLQYYQQQSYAEKTSELKNIVSNLSEDQFSNLLDYYMQKFLPIETQTEYKNIVEKIGELNSLSSSSKNPLTESLNATKMEIYDLMITSISPSSFFDVYNYVQTLLSDQNKTANPSNKPIQTLDTPDGYSNESH